MRTIGAIGQKILNASGQSSNYELVVKQRKLGGNGPIMANALACLGLDVTYLGNLGYPSSVVIYNTGSGLKYLDAYATRFPRSTAGEQDKLGGLITPR